MMMPSGTTTAMKCKKHPYEVGVGVCASCLRDRLLDLIAAQSGIPYAAPHHHEHQQARSHHHRRHHQLPPPLAFPRSVSPYVSRRRSVDLGSHRDIDEEEEDDDDDPRARRRRQRLQFFSTPQVVPGASRTKVARGGFFAALFRGGHHSRSERGEQDCAASGAPHGSTSWFSALLPGRRKKHQKKEKKNPPVFEEEEEEEEDRARRRAWRRDHGRGPGGDEDSPSESGYSTESSGGWRVAAPTPMRKRAATSGHRAMSGFVFCLSPLVRASPVRSQAVDAGGSAAASAAAATGLSGELRGTGPSSLRHHHHHHRHVSAGGGPPALASNRSRKLSDLGRFR